MITTSELKARVEKEVGAEICPVIFQKAENYARRKLNFINELAGREYGEGGYGDEYLVLLTADTVREMAFSEYALKSIQQALAEKAVSE